VPSSTRSFGDENWRTTEAAYIDAWKAAIALLADRKVALNGATYIVKIDWTPLLRRHEQHFSAMEYVEEGVTKKSTPRALLASLNRFPRKPSRIRVAVHSTSKGAKSLVGIAESVIHDIFLIMNIAAPGSCNLYKATLLDGKETNEISLSSSQFELCVLPSRRRKQTAGFVSVEKVTAWYDLVRPAAGQIPGNSTERAMFALLHMAKLSDEMLAVLWLFYALESLLQTKVGENFSAIVRRLRLILGDTINDAPLMKREMRTLYDLRSSIVHGGFEAIHPMQDESLDARVEKVFGRLMDANDYGFVLLVAAIQKMVEANWPQLRFDEVVVGESSSNL